MCTTQSKNDYRILKRFSCWLLFVASLLSFSISTFSAEPKLVTVADPVIVGGDHSFPPYEFINENGEPDGYNVELTRAIAEVMGINVRIVLGNWGDMRKALKDGEIDVLQGVVFSDERAKIFTFSPPHSIINQSVFIRTGTKKIASVGDLRNKEVIVQRDGIMHDYLIQNKISAKLILTNTHADALRLLSSGKHDYALVSNLPGLYFGREYGLSNISPIAVPFEEHKYGYAVNNNNQRLLAFFSEGLAILNNTGRKQVIYDKWLGALENRGVPWELLAQVAGATAVLLMLLSVGIFAWNRILHREVEARTSELKKNQQKLIQVDKMMSLGVLVSGVAHEINNPTSLLLLNLPVLKEVFEDSQNILDEHYSKERDFKLAGLDYSRIKKNIPLLITDTLDAANSIKRIVEELKDFSREESSIRIEEVNFNDVIRLAIRLTDASIQKASNNFTVNYADNLPKISGNPQRIEQIVVNLILNACQSLESIEASINLTTFYDVREDRVVLSVVDQGKGIKEEQIARLTDPFFTTRRDSGGTGLGLFVSAGIAQEHGGDLSFESTIGEGTIVILSLPSVQKS